AAPEVAGAVRVRAVHDPEIPVATVVEADERKAVRPDADRGVLAELACRRDVERGRFGAVRIHTVREREVARLVVTELGKPVGTERDRILSAAVYVLDRDRAAVQARAVGDLDLPRGGILIADQPQAVRSERDR